MNESHRPSGCHILGQPFSVEKLQASFDERMLFKAQVALAFSIHKRIKQPFIDSLRGELTHTHTESDFVCGKETNTGDLTQFIRVVLDNLESVLAILTVELNCSVRRDTVGGKECYNISCSPVHQIRVNYLLKFTCADSGYGKEPFGFLIQHLKRKIAKSIVNTFCCLGTDSFDLSRTKVSNNAFFGRNDNLIIVIDLKLNTMLSAFAPSSLNIVSELIRQRQTIANCLYLCYKLPSTVINLFARIVDGHHIGSGICHLYALRVNESLEFT